jgi:hypothetical protein
MKRNADDDFKIPTWLRYLLILLAVLALIGIMLKGSGPLRTDFPVF